MSASTFESGCESDPSLERGVLDAGDVRGDTPVVKAAGGGLHERERAREPEHISRTVDALGVLRTFIARSSLVARAPDDFLDEERDVTRQRIPLEGSPRGTDCASELARPRRRERLHTLSTEEPGIRCGGHHERGRLSDHRSE